MDLSSKRSKFSYSSMMTPQNPVDLSDRLAKELPYLRRYARALTGSQVLGDDFAVRTLQAILQDRQVLSPGVALNVALYTVFHEIWYDTIRVDVAHEGGALGRVQKLLATLPANFREALLLSTIEGFADPQVAKILNTSEADARALIAGAKASMHAQSRGAVLVIEDEPIISADIVTIVENAGYRVSGVARTHTEALALAAKDRPNLILADIQLADNTSGIDTVVDLLAQHGTLPVIFITAFPERLLTGTRPEPAFLITKPYTEDHVMSCVSQAMFFASTETLR